MNSQCKKYKIGFNIEPGVIFCSYKLKFRPQINLTCIVCARADSKIPTSSYLRIGQSHSFKSVRYEYYVSEVNNFKWSN